MSSAKTDRRVLTIRNGVIGFVVAIVAIVVGYGLFRATAIDVTGDFVEGAQYKTIQGAAPIPTTGPIRVTEFFSYGCIHCRNFDPMVNAWARNLRKGVLFERSPVSFSPDWELLARTYYALQFADALGENHERLFSAIHDQNKQFVSPQAVADFVNGHGITRNAFLTALESPEVSRAVSDANKRERAMHVNSVPTVIVADHYAINMDTVPRKKVFDVVDFLIQQIKNERNETTERTKARQ